MDKLTIIETLAKEKRVEALVENIAHHSLTADLKDLCQMVYLILLEYDESKIQDLWENNEINFFLARIIINQYRSSNSPFHTIFRKFQERSVSCQISIGIHIPFTIRSIYSSFFPLGFVKRTVGVSVTL